MSYQYDASGNLTNDGAHNYQYDGAGRLANVEGGASGSYIYDANNWRVKKSSGGVTTHYVWEGAQVIAEYNASTGALISEYLYAGGRMVAREQSGILRYYHADRLSTRLTTDASGVVVGTQDHLPFGEDVAGSGESEKHRFTNYERDSESNTDYAINRQHQFTNGRFMQPDPVAGSITNPQSLNHYSYVVNDPINLVDPLGLTFLEITDCSSTGSTFNGVTTTQRVCTTTYVWIDDSFLPGSIRPISIGGGGGQGGQLPQPGKSLGDLLKLAPPVPIPQLPKPTTPIYCQPDVIKAMNTAWSQSGNGGQMLSGGSGGVEAGFNLNGTPNNYRIEQRFTNETNKMTLKFTIGGSWPTFANFHVHPRGHDGVNGAPSTPNNNAGGNQLGDTGMVNKTYKDYGQAVQIYVMSQYGL